MITAERAAELGWPVSHVCPPCHGCGQRPRREGKRGPAVRLHSAGCTVHAAERRAGRMADQMRLARELAVSAA